MIYLIEGHMKTPEIIRFDYDNIKYIVNFQFTFSYDWSNGMNNECVEITTAKLIDKKTKIITIYEIDGKRVIMMVRKKVENNK